MRHPVLASQPTCDSPSWKESCIPVSFPLPSHHFENDIGNIDHHEGALPPLPLGARQRLAWSTAFLPRTPLVTSVQTQHHWLAALRTTEQTYTRPRQVTYSPVAIVEAPLGLHTNLVLSTPRGSDAKAHLHWRSHSICLRAPCMSILGTLGGSMPGRERPSCGALHQAHVQRQPLQGVHKC